MRRLIVLLAAGLLLGACGGGEEAQKTSFDVAAKACGTEDIEEMAGATTLGTSYRTGKAAGPAWSFYKTSDNLRGVWVFAYGDDTWGWVGDGGCTSAVWLDYKQSTGTTDG